MVGNAVVGSVRLKCTDEQGVLEAGVWLTRSSRGRGVAVAAMAAVLRKAAALGAQGVRADTTTGNTSALGVLRRLSFDLEPTDGERTVRWGRPRSVGTYGTATTLRRPTISASWQFRPYRST